MRLIDADAFVEFLRDVVKKQKYDDLKIDEALTVADVIDAVISELEGTSLDGFTNAPTIGPEPKWIPCSERLPEKDTHFYLTTIANHGLNFTTTLPDDVDVVRWDYDRRKGHNSWHWCTERTVIAWMPLPEPYQAERREE